MASFCNKRTAKLISKYIGYFQNFQKSPYHHFPTNYKLHYSSYRHFSSQQQSNKNDSSSTSTPLPHHYTTLNIDSNASIEDIKKSYNNLMKQWHPDLYMMKPPTQQQEAQIKFRSIREAYEIIIAYKQGGSQQSQQSAKGKMDIHKAHGQRSPSGFTSGRRVPNASFSYYSWGRKVYETQENAKNQQQSDGTEDGEKDEEEEEKELKYSETYKDKKTWIGVAIEELYDWVVFLYQRNPSWMQFFLIATACFGIVQGLWHWFNPNINDSDPDRIWNVFKGKKPGSGLSGYQPSSSAAISTTPNLVALQPHFKGHTLYEPAKRDNNDDKFIRNNIEEEFKDVEKKNSFQLFTNLNLDSTVNKDQVKKRRKRKRRGDIEITVIDGQTGKKTKKIVNRDELGKDNKIINIDKAESNNDKNNISKMESVDNEKKVEVKLPKRQSIDYNEIPLELRSTPMGILLASYAADTGDLPNKDENGQYDWSPVIKRYRELNEQNNEEILATQ